MNKIAVVLLTLSASPGMAEGVPAQWDHLEEGGAWTEASLSALSGHAALLPEYVPEDAASWCPAYETQGPSERRAFWVGFVSALAKYESTWRADVSGGDNQWHGLLQISPATAKAYGCDATSAATLKTAPANLACGLRILATTIPRDGVISRDGGGAAADWAPFSDDEKRSAMMAWTRTQPYCAP